MVLLTLDEPVVSCTTAATKVKIRHDNTCRFKAYLF